MATSQQKLLHNKTKRKLEENLVDKDNAITEKVLKTKKLKISKEVKHVSEIKRQKTNVSIKRKHDKQNAQKTLKKVVKVVNKTAKKTKTPILKANDKKSTNLNEKNDKVKDFTEELSRSHIQQCISAMFHLTENQLKNKNILAKEAQPIFMQVTCIRIPKVPRRQMRM